MPAMAGRSFRHCSIERQHATAEDFVDGAIEGFVELIARRPSAASLSITHFSTGASYLGRIRPPKTATSGQHRNASAYAGRVSRVLHSDDFDVGGLRLVR
jgi:hypothetical protein